MKTRIKIKVFNSIPFGLEFNNNLIESSYEEELKYEEQEEDSYEGPLLYMTKCENPGNLPEREKMMYEYNGDYYIFQEDNWFRLNEDYLYLAEDFFVPQFVRSEWEELQIQCPLSYLKDKIRKEITYWRNERARRIIGQNIRKTTVKMK